MFKEPSLQQPFRAELRALDLGSCVVARPGRKRTLVDRKLLNRRLFKRATEAGERIAVVEIVEVALVLARSPGDVETRLGACSGEGDVAPLLESCFAGAENERTLDGQALGRMACDRVGVAGIAALEVAAAEFDGRAAIGVNRRASAVRGRRVGRCRGCRS